MNRAGAFKQHRYTEGTHINEGEQFCPEGNDSEDKGNLFFETIPLPNKEIWLYIYILSIL